MSRLNMNNDLFLALQELNRQAKFYKDDGYIRLFRSIINDFGIVNVDIDSSFDNFKVESGTNAGTIKIAIDSYAVDNAINIITQKAIDNVAVTDDSNWYWVRIGHEESNIEEGTIDLAANGDVTGTLTKFSEVLRDQSNYPVKVNFPDSVSNTGDYQVTSVLSDTSVILSGSTGFTPENGLEYRVVGSYTPGINPTGNDRLPYFYDSCDLVLVLETVLDTPPAKTDGEQFYIARVRNIASAMTIQDKRIEFFSTSSTNVTTVNAVTYDLLVTDDILHVIYTLTGAVTSLTLPTLQVRSGRSVLIKDAANNANTNNITIDTEGAETIEGAATYVISADGGSVELYSDGSNWFIK